MAAVVNSSACQLQDPSWYTPVREVPLVNFSASRHQILQLREVPLVNFSASRHQILQLREVPLVNFSASRHQILQLREVPLVNFSASRHQILQLREVPLVNFSASRHQILQLREMPVVNFSASCHQILQLREMPVVNFSASCHQILQLREAPVVNFSASRHQIPQLWEAPAVNFSASHHQILQLREVPLVNSLACGMPDPSWYTGSGRCQGEFCSLPTIRSSWYTQLRNVPVVNPPACWLPDLSRYTQPREMPEGISLPADCQICHGTLNRVRCQREFHCLLTARSVMVHSTAWDARGNFTACWLPDLSRYTQPREMPEGISLPDLSRYTQPCEMPEGISLPADCQICHGTLNRVRCQREFHCLLTARSVTVHSTAWDARGNFTACWLPDLSRYTQPREMPEGISLPADCQICHGTLNRMRCQREFHCLLTARSVMVHSTAWDARGNFTACWLPDPSWCINFRQVLVANSLANSFNMEHREVPVVNSSQQLNHSTQGAASGEPSSQQLYHGTQGAASGELSGQQLYHGTQGAASGELSGQQLYHGTQGGANGKLSSQQLYHGTQGGRCQWWLRWPANCQILHGTLSSGSGQLDESQLHHLPLLLILLASQSISHSHRNACNSMAVQLACTQYLPCCGWGGAFCPRMSGLRVGEAQLLEGGVDVGHQVWHCTVQWQRTAAVVQVFKEICTHKFNQPWSINATHSHTCMHTGTHTYPTREKEKGFNQRSKYKLQIHKWLPDDVQVCTKRAVLYKGTDWLQRFTELTELTDCRGSLSSETVWKSR